MLKKIFGELINLMVGAVLVIAMLMAGYLIFANVYHSKELVYNTYLSDVNKTTQQQFVAKVGEVEATLNKISFEGYTNQYEKLYYNNIQVYLNRCVDEFKSSTYVTSFETIDSLTIFNLTNSFSDNVYGKCLRNHLSSVKAVVNESSYKDERIEMMLDDFEKTILNIHSSNSMVKSVLMSNSSYQFTTWDTKVSIYNENKVLYETTADNYNLSLSIIEAMVNYMATVTEGGIQ